MCYLVKHTISNCVSFVCIPLNYHALCHTQIRTSYGFLDSPHKGCVISSRTIRDRRTFRPDTRVQHSPAHLSPAISYRMHILLFPSREQRIIQYLYVICVIQSRCYITNITDTVKSEAQVCLYRFISLQKAIICICLWIWVKFMRCY